MQRHTTLAIKRAMRKHLRSAIRQAKATAGVRYLTVLWPETEEWLERIAYLLGSMRDPDTDAPLVQEWLQRISKLGTTMDNGTLRRAVRDACLDCLRLASEWEFVGASGERWDPGQSIFDAFAEKEGITAAHRLSGVDGHRERLVRMATMTMGPVDGDITASVSIHAPCGANLEEATPPPNASYPPEGGGFNQSDFGEFHAFTVPGKNAAMLRSNAAASPDYPSTGEKESI